MKRLAVIAVILVLIFLFGCIPRFTIPDEPKYRDLGVYPMSGMACFDDRGWADLGWNIQAQERYIQKLKKILEDLQKR